MATEERWQTGDEMPPIGTSHDLAMAEAEAERDPEYLASLRRLEFSEAIARAILRLRMDLGISQAELAKRVGTTGSVISRLERGDHEPSTATLRKIAEATGRRVVFSFARPRRSGLGHQLSGPTPATGKTVERHRAVEKSHAAAGAA